MMGTKGYPRKKSSTGRVDDDRYGGAKQHDKPHPVYHAFLSSSSLVAIIFTKHNLQALPEAEFLLCNSRPEGDDDGADQNSIELGQPVCYLDMYLCRLGVSLDMFVDWDIRLQISTEPTHLEGKSLWYGALMAFSPQCWYPGVNSSLCEE